MLRVQGRDKERAGFFPRAIVNGFRKKKKRHQPFHLQKSKSPAGSLHTDWRFTSLQFIHSTKRHYYARFLLILILHYTGLVIYYFSVG